MALGSASGSTFTGAGPADRQQPHAVAGEDQILHQFETVDLVRTASSSAVLRELTIDVRPA
jgi:hypothetical protein